MDKQGVNYARLSWTGETLPYSLEFNDYYYSQDDGLGESRYVYLAGNYLEERFTSSEDFLIAEFGFGTGLNFLATWDLWRKVARENSRLFYISFELSPLKPQDMRRVLSRWPELNCLSEELIELLPLPIRGLHRVSLDQGRVLLYLALGDVLEYLPYLNLGRGVDAWFLDGFSPDRNQRLWSTEVLEYLPKLSSPEATAATFSAAGEVGRTLERIGFKVHRKKVLGLSAR